MFTNNLMLCLINIVCTDLLFNKDFLKMKECLGDLKSLCLLVVFIVIFFSHKTRFFMFFYLSDAVIRGPPIKFCLRPPEGLGRPLGYPIGNIMSDGVWLSLCFWSRSCDRCVCQWKFVYDKFVFYCPIKSYCLSSRGHYHTHFNLSYFSASGVRVSTNDSNWTLIGWSFWVLLSIKNVSLVSDIAIVTPLKIIRNFKQLLVSHSSRWSGAIMKTVFNALGRVC